MKKKWKIATATTTGTYHVIGKQWGELLHSHFGWEIELINTAGSIPNIQLINEGEADFGFAAAEPLKEGWTGTGWAEKLMPELLS